MASFPESKFPKISSKPKTVVINLDCFVKSSFKKESGEAYEDELIIRKPDETEFTAYITLRDNTEVFFK